jgi:pyridoxal phosphate enzyme (YggS family)
MSRQSTDMTNFNAAHWESILRQRLAAVEERIAAACRRSSRRREEVTLIAVTKTVSPEVSALLPNLGVLDLGESRPQELWRKAAALPQAVRWHLIGHLQRNKIERTLPLVHWVHSADSGRLMRAIDDDLIRRNATLDVLLEVNVSGEASKQGFSVPATFGMAPVWMAMQKVRVRGLMTMAAQAADPERCRQTFAALRTLRDEIRPLVDPKHPLDHLSMGMSNDFEIAIEEGATMIRLGSVLFEDLPA